MNYAVLYVRVSTDEQASKVHNCGRRPKTVIVTLVGSDEEHEYDRVSLDFAKDFRMSDPTAYALRSELVLNGAR